MIPSRMLMLGCEWTAETRALVAAMAIPPGGARVVQIDTLIKSLKLADIWRLLDAFYVLAAHDSQAARLNWKSPGTFTLSPSNAPTFTTDRGYTGDGATSGLTSGPNLSTLGGQYGQDNAHMGVWIGTDATENATEFGNVSGRIRAHSGPTAMSSRANSAGDDSSTISPATAVGHSLWSRNNSADYKVYKSGVEIATQTNASVAVSNAGITVCFVGSNFSTKRIQAAHAGAALTAVQIAALHAALAAYMTALGA